MNPPCPKCHSGDVEQTSGHIVKDISHGDSFKCKACGYQWDREHEPCPLCRAIT